MKPVTVKHAERYLPQNPCYFNYWDIKTRNARKRTHQDDQDECDESSTRHFSHCPEGNLLSFACLSAKELAAISLGILLFFSIFFFYILFGSPVAYLTVYLLGLFLAVCLFSQSKATIMRNYIAQGGEKGRCGAVDNHWAGDISVFN